MAHYATSIAAEHELFATVLTPLTKQHLSAEGVVHMPMVEAARGKRRVRVSVTLTPEKKKGQAHMIPEEQNAMIRASVTRRRLVDLDLWYQEGHMATATVGSERGTAEDKAHEQWNCDYLTHQPQTTIEPRQWEAARRMTGQPKARKLQELRNLQETNMIAEIKRFFKDNSQEWHLNQINMNMLVNVCDPDDQARTPGYSLKERHEPYWVGAVLGYSPVQAATYAIAHEEWAKTTRIGGKKLGGNDMKAVNEKTWLTVCAVQSARDGTAKLRMLPETVFKNVLIRKRHRVDWSSFLDKGEPHPLRTNAAFQLEQDPELAQRERHLLPIVIHGYELGMKCFEDNERIFGAARRQAQHSLDLPTYSECHDLSPREAIEAVKRGRLPPHIGGGRVLRTGPTERDGQSIVFDRHLKDGDAIELVGHLRSNNMHVRSFTDNAGKPGAASLLTLAALAAVGRSGADCFKAINQSDVDRINTQSEWDALSKVCGIPLTVPGTGQPQQLRDDCYVDYAERVGPMHTPVQFMGCLATEEVLGNFIQSKGMDDTDPMNGTIHVYICRPRRNPQHSFLAAWQFSPSHLTHMADAHTGQPADVDDD